MDPIIINQIVPIIVGVLIVLGGRFTDAGRKNAKELKELRSWKAAAVSFYYEWKTEVARHNYRAHADDDQSLVPAPVPDVLKKELEE